MISFNVLEADLQLNNPKGKREWLKRTIVAEGKIVGEIQYILCNDKYLLAVNSKYLAHETLTDIITFSNSENPKIISGDIFISVERVKDNARALGHEFEEELFRVLVHGVLHLLGYNDHTPDEKQQMRAKEDYYLHL